MKIHTSIDNLTFNNPIVTIGIFDGVHHGHRTIIKRLIEEKRKINGEAIVITFWPHPRVVLGKTDNLKFLTSINEKIELLEDLGIDHLIKLPFTKEFSKIQACDFTKKYLVDKIGVQMLISGFNHQFGYKGKGNVKSLEECANQLKFNSVKVNEFLSEVGEVSSTTIRNFLEDGKIEEANNLLGYQYFINGTVVSGKKIGHKLGFPTANIEPEDNFKLIPKDGVYAVRIFVENKVYNGMLNIGYNPTIDSGLQKTIEVNIFNFEKDLYKQKIKLCFVSRLRNEMKFENLDELVEHLKLDKVNSLKILKK